MFATSRSVYTSLRIACRPRTPDISTLKKSRSFATTRALVFTKTRPNNASTRHANNSLHAHEFQHDWRPGQEPGHDLSEDESLSTDCEITVVDFSKDEMKTQRLDNASLPAWIEQAKKKPEATNCRWINVNGISWDVVQALAKYKGLHRLAIEDMVARERRTKVDWYPEHTHIVLTLQKLVHTGIYRKSGQHPNTTAHERADSLRSRIRDLLHRNSTANRFSSHGNQSTKLLDATERSYSHNSDGSITARTSKNGSEHTKKMRTIQGHRGGADVTRIAFMEAHSPLTRRDLAVCAEQVSIFLTSDNTVISFFESSANDVEEPILSRLHSEDTTLRRSCDASMVAQSIMDTVVDLAIPVTAAYQDAIGSLEVDVLTEPNINHARELYTVISEIAALQNAISPVAGLITSLQDSRAESSPRLGTQEQKPIVGVKISPMAHVYLGDVKDHCLILSQTLDQLHLSAHDMINLIFNTITASQNESMKKLTAATIMFLPLTFITGYFGMNLTDFPTLENNEAFFWSIAAPVALVTALMMGGGKVWHWILKRRLHRKISGR